MNKKEQSFIRVVQRKGGEDFEMITRSYADICALQLGRVGKRPAVVCQDQQDALEVSLWCYGQDAIPISLDPNSPVTPEIVRWFEPDSYIGEVPYFDTSLYTTVTHASFLSRIPFENNDIQELPGTYTLWDDTGRPIAFVCTKRMQVLSYHLLVAREEIPDTYEIQSVPDACPCKTESFLITLKG